MLDNNEIKNAVNMYETMKRDLHNHLVKKCESPLDYSFNAARGRWSVATAPCRKPHDT